MTTPTATRASLVAALLAAAACAPVVSSSGHNSVRTASADRIQGPYAPAGQRFSVQLDQPIDTMTSARRESFTARLDSPLRDASGQVIAPVGSVVRGQIRSLGSVESPRVKLRFDTVETIHGTAPMEATLRGAQYRRYPGPVLYGYYGPNYGFNDGWTYGSYWGPWGAVGGGPYYGDYGYVPYRPREVHLPTQAHLDLVLTRPLLPPGSVMLGR